MNSNNTPSLPLLPQITVQENNKLGKLQQEFNKKIKLIEKLKQEVTTRQESLNQAQKRVEKELRPIINQIIEKRVEVVKLLDKSFPLPFFRKREKENLAYLIADIAYELIAKYNRQDMVELHDKYAEFSLKKRTVQAEEETRMYANEIFEDIFGVNAEVDNLDDFEHIQSQLDREMEQREQEKQNRQKNRKTKAQLAKETKAKAEVQNISKASRRVYTELAKQLHPDREQDATVRTWKEEAMKKVTQAYHNDDFFELLRLQMEYMQQEKELHELPETQLKFYIKILSDQVNELQDKLYDFSFAPDADFYRSFCGTPKQMDKKFKEAKENMNLELEKLKQDFRYLQDPQQIRLLLKEMR
jgi:PAS domain-containing protein